MPGVWHLGDIDWLSELTPRERKELEDASRSAEYKPGDTVFRPDSSPRDVFLLQKGRVRIYRVSPEGGETTFGYVLPGEVFGELAVFGERKRESFAQAVERSVVWRLPMDLFQRTLQQRANLAFAVTAQVGDRLRQIESRVEDLVFRDVRSRLAHVLLDLGGHFGTKNGEEVVIEAAFTQSELATLVGSTRQTVNVCLGEFAQQGLVKHEPKRVRILDPKRLEELLAPRRDGERSE